MAKRGSQDTPKVHKNQTIFFKNAPAIIGSYSIVGKKEGEGPLCKTFNRVVEDDYFGEKTHEGCEQKMFEHAIRGAIKDAGMKPEQVDMMMAGDLLNQIISSSFAARSFDMAFVGLYGACSTMALTLAMAASLVDGGHVNSIAVCAGSHFATAERQYRTPLELGNQRPPVSQWTVTGAGATVIRRGGASKAFSSVSGISGASPTPLRGVRRRTVLDAAETASKALEAPPRITAATIGKVVDWGVKDVNNMGAAMAPAAAATLVAHFRDTGRTPADYCHIFSGDLGKLGENVFRDLMANANYPVDARYSDCGRLIYSEEQNLYQGGSGCGCSAVTFNGFIMDKLRKGEYKRVLFVATGALLSPVSSYQGNTIPGIAHAVVIEA